MSFHNGSRRLAHHLDRFSPGVDFEDAAGEAARLKVTTRTLRMYHDWYGSQVVTVVAKDGMKAMPAYEVEIRREIHGERLTRCEQLELPFPPTNHYSYEHRGW